jgi:hypothetical protein
VIIIGAKVEVEDERERIPAPRAPRSKWGWVKIE